jgi:hypothetical protein
VLEAEWQDDDGQPLHPVAYSVGGWYGPLLPGGRNQEERLPRILAKLGEHGEAVASAYGELPEIPRGDEYDWQARQEEERRERECFALTDEDADAARAFGCLLELPGPDGRGEHLYVTDREWLADRLVQRIAAHTAAESERKQREREARTPTAGQDDAEKEARRQQRPARVRSAGGRARPQPRPRCRAREVAAEARHGCGEACSARSCSSITARRRHGRIGCASSSRRRRTSRPR